MFKFFFPLIVIMQLTTVPMVWAGESEETEDFIEPSRPPVHAGIDFQFLPVFYNSATLDGTNAIGLNASLGGRFAFDWIFLNKYGKLGIGLGMGFTTNSVSQFHSVPLDLALTYRFDYLKNQVLVPYAKVGLEMTLGLPNGSAASMYTGLMYGFGAELLLNLIDRQSANNFFSNIGVSYTYLTFEYVISSQLALITNTANYANSGFRVGLRFEI